MSRDRISGILAAAVLLVAGHLLAAPSNASERGRFDVHHGTPIGGDERLPNPAAAASVVDDDGHGVSPLLSASVTASPPSPGLSFAETLYDSQHNLSSGYQTGRQAPNGDIVHFCYMALPVLPQWDLPRFVFADWYSISSGAFIPIAWLGAQISESSTSNGGYPDLAMDKDGALHIAFYQRSDQSSPYMSWHAYCPTPGSGLHLDDELLSTPVLGEVLWPQIAINRNSGWQAASNPDIAHIVSHGGNSDPRNRIVYWRYNGVAWEGPVAIDSNFRLGYVVAADANSDKVALLLHTDREPEFNGLLNVAYYESQTQGAGWIDGSELGDANKRFITDYTDPSGPQAWGHISAAYGNSSVLQVIWDEQRTANTTGQVAIRHWDDLSRTIRPVAYGYWDNPVANGVFDLNLAKMTLGIGDGGTLCSNSPGDGTNRDYLYVVYTQFGGPSAAEQADHSLEGFMNGELYLTVSNSGGNTWSAPRNLTNTKTPNCNPGQAGYENGGVPLHPDSVCRSEHWATIGQLVHDIDIIYISDIDAGGAPFGEGYYELNPVKYFRLPGGITNAPFLCPLISPNSLVSLSDNAQCEYHAPRGGFAEATLTVSNIGNATMTGNVTASQINGPAGWLIVMGGGNYTIPSGGADVNPIVRMDASGIAAEGLYQGAVQVTHNDTTKANPLAFPIDFFVVDQFFCPESEILRTGVASPGSLALAVESDGRFGAKSAHGGLWRYADTSSAIYDASLLIAHGTQGLDTVVFNRFGERVDPGQFGFRALSDLEIDTSHYGAGSGYATATARMATKDSAVAVTAEWIFPQHPDSDEFVLVRYTIRGVNGSSVDNLLVGVLVDENVLPASRYAGLQMGNNNVPDSNAALNLVWQQGADIQGHVITETPPNTATRYRAGVSVIQNKPLIGAHVGDGEVSADALWWDGGPTSRFLYRELARLNGISLFAVAPYQDPDLYTLVTLARGITLAPTDTARIVIALVSDTLSRASFLATTKKAWAFAAAHGFKTCVLCCQCPCFADPQCDGVTDILDVTTTIDVAFRGIPAVGDPNCLQIRTDLDCSGATDVVDVVKMVNVAFRGADPLTQFCKPCGT